MSGLAVGRAPGKLLRSSLAFICDDNADTAGGSCVEMATGVLSGRVLPLLVMTFT